MKTAQLSDISIAYQEVGSGPVLLLVHGFPLDHTMWSDQITALSDEFRVIAPDLRGYGQTPLSADGSGDDKATVTMRQYADDLAQLLDALAITEPIIFCGLSMGGYVAWQFAQAYPTRLRALILCDTKAVGDTEAAATQRLEIAAKVLEHGSEFLAQALSIKLIADGTARDFPEVARCTRDLIAAAAPTAIAASQRGMAARPDVSEWLPACEWPALLIVGEHDDISPPEEMRRIAAALPQAELVEIAQAGHLTSMERPEQVNAAIRNFLNRLHQPAG